MRAPAAPMAVRSSRLNRLSWRKTVADRSSAQCEGTADARRWQHVQTGRREFPHFVRRRSRRAAALETRPRRSSRPTPGARRQA